MLALACTGVASAMAGSELARLIASDIADDRWALASWHLVFSLIAAVLVYGAFVYLLARLSYVWRRSMHRPESRDAVETL